MQVSIHPLISPQYGANGCSQKIRVFILCEDESTATRAQTFARQMAETMGVETESLEDFWHVKMLTVPAVSSELAQDAASYDHLIISLRGDSPLSTETKHWFAQLNAPSTKLSVLIDPRYCRLKTMLSTLRYLKKATRVSAFSYYIGYPKRQKKKQKTVIEKSLMASAFPHHEMAACSA